ncbi:hypothetical protein C8J57DRAFT_287078 [Mycena rebaudengoi]|nr:hypothetical protein C8J57DRAFT_287078 [Mycena rebaudengoi]
MEAHITGESQAIPGRDAIELSKDARGTIDMAEPANTTSTGALDPSLAAQLAQFHISSDQNSAISYLPVEIMSEIFTHFLPDYPQCPPLTGRLSPALLGQICGTWRQIAFDTPWLWRAIHIYLSSAGESTMTAQLNVLTTWLSRSKICPLSISFEIQFDLSSPTLPHFTAALISHSGRWQHLVLDIPFDDFRSLDHFPLLRDLTLGPSRYGPTGALTVFHSAPQLKRVLFGRLLNPSRVNLPWAQLTHILARNLFLPVAAQILWQASALVEFTCILKAGGDIFGDAVAPLIHLESLILYVWDGMAIQKQVLDALTAPMLRHLTISEHSLGEQLVPTLAAFFS